MKNIFRFRVSLDNANPFGVSGADRNATAGTQAWTDSTLDVESMSNVVAGFFDSNRAPYAKPLGKIKFKPNESLHIIGVRALVDGLPGIRRAMAKPAFVGSILACDGSDVSEPVELQVENYGVEYPANFEIRAKAGTTGEWGFAYGNGSQFSFDDFAVIMDFIGQQGKPTIEFTAEIMEADNA